ncbi:MAG: hypothetical protein AB7F79_09925 [Steroidobacteraceae bacterium]
MPRTFSRSAQLQARCEMQRMQLAEQVAVIEQRWQRTDEMLGSVRNVLTSPALLAGGLALLLGAGRSGWWTKLSRGVVLLTTARRIYYAFKHK